MNDLEPLGRLVEKILELHPETLESYDDKTMRLAARFSRFSAEQRIYRNDKICLEFLARNVDDAQFWFS